MFFRLKKETTPTFDQELDTARRNGFTVEAKSGGSFEISKHGCAAVIQMGGGCARFVRKPGWLVRGEIATLVDKGYQKLLETPAGAVQPALAPELRAIHDFDAELRQVFRLTSLYNESLGTTSTKYVYDRVKGRE